VPALPPGVQRSAIQAAGAVFFAWLIL